MKNSFYSTVVCGMALFLGTGLGHQGPAQENGLAKPATRQQFRTEKPSVPCKTGDTCEDTVLRARRLGENEADQILRETICGFLAEYGLLDQDVPRKAPSGYRANVTYCEKSGAAVPEVDPRVRPEVVIAVLPDPVHTQLALRFDESVDELENSIQDLGWRYDRAWLSWDSKEHEDQPEFEKRMEGKYGQEGYERSPGAILFRGSLNSDRQGPKQPLVVLVVGDTPTTGVDRVSFLKAIKIWKQLTGWDKYIGDKPSKPADPQDPDGAGVLNILGPTYSGSIPSLKSLIYKLTSELGDKATEDQYICPLNKPFTVNVASGTVSNEDELFDLSSTPNERYKYLPRPKNACGNLSVVVTSMAANIDNEWLATLDFIQKHQAIFGKKSADPLVVAHLTEAESVFGAYDDTLTSEGAPPAEQKPKSDLQKALDADTAARKAYGEAVARKDMAAASVAKMQMLSDNQRVLVAAAIDESQRAATAQSLVDDIRPLHFYFPREISSLRSAYEQNKIFGFNSETNTVQTQLHLSLGSATTHGDDTVHTFSGTEGAAAMEAEMVQLATELIRRRVNIVVLSATDPLDEIFVTRYLAQHAPNISVIVSDADELFLRDGDSSMQNAYVISPWPLLPGNERWSQLAGGSEDENFPPIRLHESSGGQGLYNAVQYLMCAPAETPMDTCGPVSDATNGRKVRLREYHSPIDTGTAGNNFLADAPPLWLSVIEHGSYWPIALVDVDEAKDGLPEAFSWPWEYRRNLPLLRKVDYNADGQIPLSTFKTRGIHEHTPNGVVILACIIALLLAAHVLACFRARLDRTYAWAYALADEKHHRLRLRLQTAIALAVILGLVLLKAPVEAGIVIRAGYYTTFNWLLQGVAVFLAGWLSVCLTLLSPWIYVTAKGNSQPSLVREPGTPPAEMDKSNEEVDASRPEGTAVPLAASQPAPQKVLSVWRRNMLFALKGALLLVFWLGCNLWLWDVLAPPASVWPSERAFFFYRSGHLFGGSSPVLPILLLAGALVVFLWSIFARLVFYDNRIPQLPDMSWQPQLQCPSQGKVALLNAFLSGNWDRWRWTPIIVVTVALGLLVAGLHDVIPRSLTHGRFDVAVMILSGIVTWLMMYDLVVAVTAWVLLRNDVLRRLARSPLRWGFTWIKGWSWRRMWSESGISPDTVLDYLRRLAEANRRAFPDTDLEDAFTLVREQMMLEPKRPTAAWAASVTQRMGQLHEQIAATCKKRLIELQDEWKEDFGPITGTDVKDEGLAERGLYLERPISSYAHPAEAKEWRIAHDRMAKEEFVALLYLGYIRLVLLQIRNRIVTAAAMYVLLLWGLTSYPFLNRHGLVTLLAWLLVGLATAVIWVYSQMHRDEILSRTTETTSGKLDADFFTKILSLVGIPLVTLIASQFPAVSNVLFSWLEPTLSAIK